MTQRERQILQLIESDPLISQQDIAAKLGITRSSVAVHISNLTKKGCIAGRGYVLRSGSYAVELGCDAGGDKPAEELVRVITAVAHSILDHVAEVLHGIIQVQLAVGVRHRFSTPV